jgi:glyoxylase-like metal-dependent hydrolase (beta-lactamase superfamily II)
MVHCFTTGVARSRARHLGPLRYVCDAWEAEVLPVNAFVVEHPRGLCLFDCGQTARAAVPGYLPRWHPWLRLSRFELAQRDEIGNQLREAGLGPADVRWVVLSHLHTDHVGGLDSFRHAEVLVSRTEWRLARGAGGRLRGYLPQHWPHGLKPRLVDFTGPPVGPFAGSCDVAGDRELLLVPTPGHTRGHMSMLVRGANRNCSYLLCGDAAHTAEELAAVDPDVGAFCRSERVVALASHDPAAAQMLGSRA